MKKKIFFTLLILIVILFAAYQFIYHGHRNIADESVSSTETTQSLFTYFTQDEISANAKFLDKTVLVKGVVTNIDFSNKSLVLDDKISAQFGKDVPSGIKLQDSISIKGRVIGFDSLLEEIKMDQCSLP